MHQDGRDSRPMTKAAVFDTNSHGLQTKNMINDIPHSGIQVVAFVDDLLSKSGKLMEGLPIYDSSEMSFRRLKEDGVGLLIIANEEISKEKLNHLVDTCLKFGIKVQQVPPV